MAVDPQVRQEMDAADLKKLNRLKAISARYKGQIIVPPGARQVTPNTVMKHAKRFRDEHVWQLPILPGAALVFQQLAAGREWKIIGTTRGAARAVEYMQSAETRAVNGMRYIGFEDYIKRRALDWLFVGRTAFRPGNEFLEYLDPTELSFIRTNGKLNTPVKDSERVWAYAPHQYFIQEQKKYLRFDEVFINHPIPMGGGNLFMSPVAPILPVAYLAWLVQEHDSAALDGRKIRDLIFVANDNIVAAVTEALESSLALYAGVDVSKAGLPIVALNVAMTGTKLADQVFILGISKIPEAFDREKFIFGYVNQISAALGLTLRHFWNNEQTTNKALEEVQEQRQQLKGPAAFTRSEQRQINGSKMLQRFGRATRFSFIEEVDSASMATNAKVLKDTADALAAIQKVFGGSLSLEAYLGWMQSIGQLPSDLELISAGASDTEVISNPDENPTPVDDGTDVAPSQPTTQPQAGAKTPAATDAGKSLEIDYDEVAINQDGRIIERRSKVFSVVSLLLAEMRKQEPEPDPEQEYEKVLAAARSEALTRFEELIDDEDETLKNWTQNQAIYLATDVENLVEIVRSGEAQNLTPDHYAMMEFIFDCIEAVPDQNA